jgi:hypothetical protein
MKQLWLRRERFLLDRKNPDLPETLNFARAETHGFVHRRFAILA